MSILSARTATPTLSYNGGDATAIVYPSLVELIIKEGINFTGDAVTLRLADPEGLFRRTWSLKAVVPIELSIQTQNWNYAGEQLTRNFGTFTVTRCDIGQNRGQGTIVSLYASTINPCTPGRLQKNSTGTNDVTLSQLTATIAQNNGLTPHYLAKVDPPFSRVDQSDQSDYVFLQRLCRQNDLFMKVKDQGLWVSGLDDAEKQSPVGTIICPTPGNPGGINGVGGIISWFLSDTVEDASYAGCSVAFRDLMSGKTVFGSATDPTAEPGSPKLEDKNNPITSPGRKIYDGQQAGAKAGDFGWAGPDPVQPVTPPPVNADAVAMAKLKGKNRKRRHHSFVVPMNLTIESATVFTLSGFAAGFDGPWLLMHTENRMMGKAGDTTTLDMQKCLDF